MNCCIECFRDGEIRKIIASENITGNCDYCGCRDVSIYPICGDGAVEELLNRIVEEYSITIRPMPLLAYALNSDWRIFSNRIIAKKVGTQSAVSSLIKSLGTLFRQDDDDIYSMPVELKKVDEDYAFKFGVIRGNRWNEFSEKIKHGNRFHNDLFNADAMASFLSYAEKSYPENSVLYRARRADGKDGYISCNMGAPPSAICKAGRINPEGISVLYLASDADTALSEIRASTYDYVSIGMFRAKKPFQVVSLHSFSNISPFVCDDLYRYVINSNVLVDFSDAVSKPLRRNDSPLDYLPTQYITEFIKSITRYDGVEYTSTMNPGGMNVAIFDEELFNCIEVQTVEVSTIKFQTKPPINNLRGLRPQHSSCGCS